MIALTHSPLDEHTDRFESEQGAEARFLGIVRETEAGAIITGIRYTAYEPMALSMMQQLRAQALAAYGDHDLALVHRLGFVPAREPSILIRVRTKHSALSFDLCRWYLEQVKKTVPIWKEIVTAQPVGSTGILPVDRESPRLHADHLTSS